MYIYYFMIVCIYTRSEQNKDTRFRIRIPVSRNETRHQLPKAETSPASTKCAQHASTIDPLLEASRLSVSSKRLFCAELNFVFINTYIYIYTLKAPRWHQETIAPRPFKRNSFFIEKYPKANLSFEGVLRA